MRVRACSKFTGSVPILMLLLSLTAGWFQPQALAQAKTPAAKPATTNAAPSNRFLFVVDTSAAMKKHWSEVQKAVDSILRHSASGQLHRGDTLGMWTYNVDVYTGAYALQTWLPENMDEISLMTAEFLKQQKFGKASRFDLALGAVQEIVKRSDIITVFLISTGEGKVQGTPFDDDLNALYRQILQENKGVHMPVVTVLQGKGGKLFRFTANMLPWPVVIPEVPIAVKVTAAAAPVQPAPVTNAPVQSPQVQSPPPMAANTPQTLQPATITPPATAPVTTPIVTPAVTAPPVVVAQPPPAFTPPANVPPAITPATAPPQAQPPFDRANMMPHPVTAPLSAAPGPPPSQPDAIAASEPPPMVNPPIRQVPQPVVKQPAATPEPEPEPAVVPEPAKTPVLAEVKKTPAASNSRTANTNTTKAQTAAAIPPAGMNQSKIYLIAGAALVVLALVLIVRLMIRGRAYRPSLISNTMGGPPKH